METIVAQQGMFKTTQKFYSNFKKAPKERLTKSYLETRLEMLEQYWSTFFKQHCNITTAFEEATLEADPYILNDVYEKCEEVYLEMKTTIKEKLQEFPTHTTPQLQTSQRSAQPVLTKLPPILIPKFSGDYKEWKTFEDLFTSVIHNNTSLSDIQKYHYLKTSLCGEAEQLLKHFPLTESNYLKARDVLAQRYNNKRSIVHTHLKILLDQKKLNNESPRALRELLDTTRETLLALDNIDVCTSGWDPLIIHITISKLDQESHKQWELSLGSSIELPSFQQLCKFMEMRFRALESISTSANKTVTKTFTVSEHACSYCSQSHYICHCKEFAALEVPARSQFVKSNGLCFNCLVKGHGVKSCKQNTSCRICKRKHHSLLHLKTERNITETTTTPEQQTTTTTSTSHTYREMNQVILPTTLVKVNTQDGATHVLRALVDQGFQTSFITEAAAQLLRLKKTPIQGRVTGIDPKSVVIIKSQVAFQISSLTNPSYHTKIELYVVKKLMSVLPAQNIPIDHWLHKLKNLADPTYHKPGKIDLILGAEVYAQILLHGLKKDVQTSFIAQNSHLGWLLSGGVTSQCNNINNNHVVMHTQVEQLLRKFWEIEDQTTEKRELTHPEKECEKYYKETHTRTDEGRYVVRLPFHTPDLSFGDSRSVAVKRLQQMEKRFDKQPEHKEEYVDFMRKYEQQGHMELVSDENKEEINSYYLPHHAVIRESSTTTRLRVVFDASSKDSNGSSLNDMLHPGPSLLNDIRDTVLRWRTHLICLVGDVKQMYRQILVAREDIHYQRIVWRESSEEEIKDYNLLTVTYGTSSAPYLAIRTLKQLADDEVNNYPLSVLNILRDDFYMDDLMSGSSSEDGAIELYHKITSLMKKGGFELRKWASNSPTVLEKIPPEDRQLSLSRNIPIEDSIKALGLSWKPTTDNFVLRIDLLPEPPTTTKRTVLSDIAKLFDPLGWLAPTIVIAKIMVQKLWLACIDWDDDLPDAYRQEWQTYRNELTNMQEISLDRWIGLTEKSARLELHGFSDASTAAYAAVVYARVINGDEVKVSILSAKTKVAPIKQISLPRLELCGALLLAQLLKRIKACLHVADENVFAWTDATIVMAWLQRAPSHWKVFVANRVSEILGVLNSNKWHHVSSSDNPADCATRGVNPSLLGLHELWWNGPKWLHTKELVLEKCNVPSTNLECKVTAHTVKIEDTTCYFERFSTLCKLIRVTAYCLRFSNNCKAQKNNNNAQKCNFLTVDELKYSMQHCVKLSQNLDYSDEIAQLTCNKSVSRQSKLISLNPLLQDGILKVGGRLGNSLLEPSMKHPIILSRNTHLSYLIVQNAHKKTLHGGPQIMLNYIRQNYWIIGVKHIIKKYYHSCITCYRHAPKPLSQLMGNLPEPRVVPNRAFSQCGVDFAGPILLKIAQGRGLRTTKGYISLFICLSTKAIHLELVSDLSSQAFIAAFKRFTARRGHCENMYSDCGTNFIGANNELDVMFQNSQINLPQEIIALLANDGTSWNFIPPSSPNFGGLWEAGVKSVKYHLKRVIGETKLTYEEYYTLLTQIEACLNSRPITPISDSTDDMSPLTPGHFLVGQAPITVPEEDLLNVPTNRLNRWQLTQRLMQSFWRRWSSEYLSTLQTRYKWKVKTANIEIGTLVLIKDERIPPGKWLLGRVIEKHPGTDGLTRVVTIQSKSNKLKRPITKLCPLPLESVD